MLCSNMQAQSIYIPYVYLFPIDNSTVKLLMLVTIKPPDGDSIKNTTFKFIEKEIVGSRSGEGKEGYADDSRWD